jgi:hypothetical protein
VERFQRLGPHGELVEPWAASFFSILLAIAAFVVIAMRDVDAGLEPLREPGSKYDPG